MVKHGLPAVSTRRGLMGRSLALSGALASVGFVPAIARAQEEATGKLKEVLDRGRVIVGTGSATPPWHFEDEEGQLVGMDVEMGRILAKGLFGDPEMVEFVVQAADARIPNLLSGKVDVVIQFMSVTMARAQQVEFTIPYYREAITILFLKDSPYNTLADVQGKGITLSALQNPHIENVAREGVSDAKVEQFDSVANTFLALDAGRVDAALADFSTAQWMTAQNPDKYKYAADTWATHNYSAAVAPGDQRWLNFVDDVFLDAMTGFEFAAFRDAFRRFFAIDVEPIPAGLPLTLAERSAA